MEPWLFGSSTEFAIRARRRRRWTSLSRLVGWSSRRRSPCCSWSSSSMFTFFAFLSVLLVDEEALRRGGLLHRLLTPGERDELELVESS